MDGGARSKGGHGCGGTEGGHCGPAERLAGRRTSASGGVFFLMRDAASISSLCSVTDANVHLLLLTGLSFSQRYGDTFSSGSPERRKEGGKEGKKEVQVSSPVCR